MEPYVTFVWSSSFNRKIIIHNLQDTVEIQKNAIKAGQKVIVIDDLLATGGKNYYESSFSKHSMIYI